MTVQRTLDVIDRELSDVLEAYEPWFHAEEPRLAFAPSTGWSQAQILEHVTLTNHFLLILIRKGKKKALELAAKSDLVGELAGYRYNLDELEAIGKHKAFVWMRPEHMEPTGKMSPIEVRALLARQISECKTILGELGGGEGALHKTTMTVNGLGKIDVYQYLYFLCQHAKRHIAQMQGVNAEYEAFRMAE
ncbi:DinB family protein [Paenibacillus glycinis]|uniref:DinB family protein n=1 Tax=Paenibacillus glycinis TaxID=2697035 RepID=A0ABW9XRW8_9BACL|nr:DinB family protein [Paenibacillus glycinis]NBD25396.1 DinB family protein [Paenibacillus glycinis]